MTASFRLEDIRSRLLGSDPTDWMADAACPGHDPNLFFADETTGRGHAYTEARRICFNCPVRTTCLEYAFRHHIEHGYWGGMTPNERRAEVRRRRRNLRVAS